MSRQHNRRQRKKLRLGEFTEYGFEFTTVLKANVSQRDQEALVEKLLAEVTEPRALMMGGWINNAFVAKFGPGSATAEDQSAIQAWLQACPEVESVSMGPLVDANR